MSSSSGPSVSSLTVARGTLDSAPVARLAELLNCTQTAVILAAINTLHYRYTGLPECDIILRVAAVGADGTTIGSGAQLTSVLKSGMTVAAVAQAAQEVIAPVVTDSPAFHLEFHQLISAELSSSGFQHLVHITVHARGSGKKRKIDVRYEFPPMLTAGQADPRLRVSQHLPGILSGLLALAEKGDLATTPIHELQFLPLEERRNLMRAWSGLDQYDLVDRSDQLLHELFEETARKFPDRIAIECATPPRSMTYAQMSRRTNQLARWMRNNGVAVGSYVGMWLPRGIDAYIALIAILKAGAAYVPCDSEYPSDRVNFILGDCEAPVLVTHSEQLTLNPDFTLPPGCKQILYDQVDALMEEQDDTFPTREQTGQTNEDVCYVIYTSGSTGRPKGCQLEHRSAVNLVRAERILFGVHENDRVYQGFSIAFDASVEEVWMAFASGAALVAATPDMLHAGPGLPGMLVAQRITIISTVPTLLSMMEDTLPDVRILISGGEAVQKDIIKRWSKGRRFINTYGPTEATVIATHIDTSPSHALVTIGRAVPSYFLYILDANLNPCPVGVGGELHIGGLCVARGYLGRPELTAEKFIPYPKHKLWCDDEADPELERMIERSPRLYKAGDLCRWTEDGQVEFCGRIDAQVKLRGYRVELAEIESVLMAQTNILSAVVSVREDVPGIQNLIGYVILRDPSLEFNQDALKDDIRIRLPPYMVPACIDVLTRFPTLPSGKVNRKELPPPKNLVVINYDEDPDEADAGAADAGAGGEVVPKNLDAVETDPNYFPPRTALEKKLAQMWRKLFQRPRISSTDDFFTLGGHSLLAAWLVSALRKDPNTEHVTMADVYGFPKLRDMACKLQGGDPSELPSAEEEAAAVAAAPPAPVSWFGQEEKEEEVDDGLPIMQTGGGATESASLAALANYAPIDNGRFILCGLAQLVSLYLLYALPAMLIGIPWEFFLKIRSDGYQYVIVMLIPFCIAVFPVYLLIAILAKWALIGRYEEGKHALWSWFYFRHWLVQRLTHYVPLIYLRGSPVLNMYFRLMGASIGRNVFLNTHHIEAPDLVEIGEDSSIGIDAQLINFHVEGNWLFIRRVVIGKCTYVGARSVVSGGSVMCDHSQLGALSLLTQGARIPPWEHWRGSPAVKTARVENYMPRSIVHAGAAVASQGGLSRGMNGHDDDAGRVLSSSLSKAQQDSLYDADDEELAKSPSKVFLSSDLTEHLLGADDNEYVGVGDESIAWNMARPSTRRRFLLGLGQTAVLTLLLPGIILISIFPGMILLHHLMPNDSTFNVDNVRFQLRATWQFLAASAPMALAFTALLCWQITIVKWVLIGQIQPGDYKVHSWFYLRKWTVDTLMQLSIQLCKPIYSTCFLVPWFRSLGAIIGDRCEIATAVYAAPDLIQMGAECFLADTVYLGVPAVHMGTIRLAKIVLGDRVFVGNGAVLPMQTVIESNSLIGVMSAPPLAQPPASTDAVMHWPEPALRCEAGTAWLGNPAMNLPNRQKPHTNFDVSTLYTPGFGLKVGRLCFEFVKMTLPFFLYLMSLLILMGDFELIEGQFSHRWQFWVLWPTLYMGAGVGCCFVVILLKWILIGKYIASEHPLWSSFIWRHDLITALLDSLAHPYWITQLRGTPFVCMWFRLLGADIGARVWMDTTAITEPDLVHVGDDCALHDDAQLQTHLFEDRVLKMSHLYLGNKCSVGNSAVVLYDSVMEEASHLLALSLLMKGESLPSGTSWHGVPAHQTTQGWNQADREFELDSVATESMCP